MRLIDADALIEKCGDWYVEEGTESGFIGTLKTLLATEPTIQPQSTTGQLNDGAQSTAQSTDLIDRGQAIEKFTMTAPQMSVIRIYEAVEILESMPTIQPEPQEGHWIGSDGSYICSECNGDPLDFIDTMGASCDAYVETLMKFCPNCGAKMTISTK